MTFDCNIVRTSTIQAVNIKTSCIYYVVRNTTTTESIPTETTSVETDPITIVETATTTHTTPPPKTTIQGSKETHEAQETTHAPEITSMATKDSTQEITPTEPDIAKRKNDSKCLLYRIICFCGIKDFHTRYALLMILFLKTSIPNPEIFAIRILI